MLTAPAPTPTPVPPDLKPLYEVAKANAVTDGAFPELLLEHYFLAAFDRVLSFCGTSYPQRTIREPVGVIPYDGWIVLSQPVTGMVRFWNGTTVLALLPAVRGRVRATSILCCQCCLAAEYEIGVDICSLPPATGHAIVRLFTYMVENRGDGGADEGSLSKSGAKDFLWPYTASVL